MPRTKAVVAAILAVGLASNVNAFTLLDFARLLDFLRTKMSVGAGSCRADGHFSDAEGNEYVLAANFDATGFDGSADADGNVFLNWAHGQPGSTRRIDVTVGGLFAALPTAAQFTLIELAPFLTPGGCFGAGTLTAKDGSIKSTGFGMFFLVKTDTEEPSHHGRAFFFASYTSADGAHNDLLVLTQETGSTSIK